MKKAAFWGVFFGVVLQGSALAAPLRGALENVDPGHELVIRDDSGDRLAMPDGLYEAELSAQTRSFSLRNVDTYQQVRVTIPGGFPGGQIRSFFIPGRAMGQDFDMSGATQDLLSARWSTQERQPCVFYDLWQCRMGCMGTQLVQVDYQAWQRNFIWTFQRSGKPVARFNSVLESGLQQVGRYPLTACWQ